VKIRLNGLRQSFLDREEIKTPLQKRGLKMFSIGGAVYSNPGNRPVYLHWVEKAPWFSFHKYGIPPGTFGVRIAPGTHLGCGLCH
jgi:hypothetical protein